MTEAVGNDEGGSMAVPAHGPVVATRLLTWVCHFHSAEGPLSIRGNAGRGLEFLGHEHGSTTKLRVRVEAIGEP